MAISSPPRMKTNYEERTATRGDSIRSLITVVAVVAAVGFLLLQVAGLFF